MTSSRVSARMIATFLLVACQSGGGGSTSTASAPRPAGLCRGLDADGREMRDALIRIATSNDSGPVRTRAALHIPAMPADSVILVNDASICERAAAPVTRFRGPPARGYETLNVFRVGPLYVVNRPDGHAGIVAWVLDMNFKMLQGLGL